MKDKEPQEGTSEGTSRQILRYEVGSAALVLSVLGEAGYAAVNQSTPH